MQKHTASALAEPETSLPAVPASWRHFTERYPELAAAYDALSQVCRDAGPLDSQTVALVKLAVSVGCHAQRTTHAHAKKALRAGVTADALRHVARVALPTVGLPAALDALAWIEECIHEAGTTDSRSRTKESSK